MNVTIAYFEILLFLLLKILHFGIFWKKRGRTITLFIHIKVMKRLLQITKRFLHGITLKGFNENST